MPASRGGITRLVRRSAEHGIWKAMDGPTRARTFPGADELLALAPWMRSLALALVGGERAEDLLQETWLAAARRGEGLRDPRAWLAKVMRNAARMGARGEARRRSREERAARNEALPSAAELAAEAELQELAVRIVLELEEPYRETLLLRFYRGLEPSEIARRTGLPASTVRNRLQRGLAEVRARLDQRHDGRRESWALAIVMPHTGASSLPIAAALAAGVLMNAKWIVAGAVAAGAAAILFFREPGTDRSAPSTAGLNDDRSELALEIPPEQPASIATHAREPLVAPARSARTESLASERWDGRVVDSSGAPLPLARVWVVDVPHIGDEHTAVGPSVETDAEGRFRLPSEHRRGLDLYAEHPGFRPAWSEGPAGEEPPQPIEIVLSPAAVLEGVVFDRDSGAPLGGTRLTFGDSGWRDGALRAIVADAAGRFRFEAAAPDEPIFLAAAAPGRISQVVQVDPPHGPLRRAEIALAPGSQLAGRVLDVETGAPVSGADVRVNFELAGESGDEGEFELAGFTGDPVLVEIVRAGYATTSRRMTPDPGKIAVFPLVAGCILEGRILGHDRRPAAGARVVAVHDPGGARLPAGFSARCPVPEGTVFQRLSTVISTRTDADGCFRLDELSPFMEYRDLTAALGEESTVRNGPFSFSGPRELQHVELVFPADGGTIRGLVRLDGAPASAHLRWDGERSGGAGRTDRQGRFRLENVEAGPVRLRVIARSWPDAGAWSSLEGRERSEAAALRASAYLAETELELELAPGELLERLIDLAGPRGRIAGRVRTESGQRAGMTHLNILLPDGETVRTPTEPDGSFDLRLDADPGAKLAIAVLDHLLWFDQGTFSVGEDALELTIPDCGALRVRVTDEHGAPRSFSVAYRQWPEDPWQDLIEPWMRTLEGGVFELELPATTLDLRFTSVEPGLGEELLSAVRVPSGPESPLAIVLPAKK